MAGIERDTPIPSEIKLHQKSRRLELVYAEGENFSLDFEFLRVYTPSAEARGHAPGQETLQTGKREVVVDRIELVGHYAVQPTFDDGHESGIFTWDYLFFLGSQQDQLWTDYVRRLQDASADRDAPMAPTGGHSHGDHACGGH